MATRQLREHGDMRLVVEVACGLCHKYRTFHTFHRDTEAPMHCRISNAERYAREAGWSKKSHDGWVCPNCKRAAK